MKVPRENITPKSLDSRFYTSLITSVLALSGCKLDDLPNPPEKVYEAVRVPEIIKNDPETEEEIVVLTYLSQLNGLVKKANRAYELGCEVDELQRGIISSKTLDEIEPRMNELASESSRLYREVQLDMQSLSNQEVNQVAFKKALASFKEDDFFDILGAFSNCAFEYKNDNCIINPEGGKIIYSAIVNKALDQLKTGKGVKNPTDEKSEMPHELNLLKGLPVPLDAATESRFNTVLGGYKEIEYDLEPKG